MSCVRLIRRLITFERPLAYLPADLVAEDRNFRDPHALRQKPIDEAASYSSLAGGAREMTADESSTARPAASPDVRLASWPRCQEGLGSGCGSWHGDARGRTLMSPMMVLSVN